MVAALLQRGFDYLSDEAAAFDPISGKVYPFPKRLHLDVDAVELFPELRHLATDAGVPTPDPGERPIRPEDIGGRQGQASEVRAIAFLSEEREGPARLSAIPKAEAVERMAANSFNLYRYGDRGVVLLSRIAAETDVYVISGGTAFERADLLDREFGVS